MIYKDIQHQYGSIFIFEKDIDNDNMIRYMVIDGRGHLNNHSAIVQMDNGRIALFGEYDDILKDKVILVVDLGK